jgi:hypothetical protein
VRTFNCAFAGVKQLKVRLIERINVDMRSCVFFKIMYWINKVPI